MLVSVLGGLAGPVTVSDLGGCHLGLGSSGLLGYIGTNIKNEIHYTITITQRYTYH